MFRREEIEGRTDLLPRRAWLIMPLAVVLFVAAGLILEQIPGLDQGRLALRGHAGPGGVPDSGDVARLLEDSAHWLGARGVLSGNPPRIPSTLVLSEEQIDTEVPTLSIVADEDSLYDPDTGILVNRRAKGRDWERLSWISYWEGGRLLVASRAGLRVHGDRARGDLGILSFRLNFRPLYGTSAAQGAKLLGGQVDAAPAVVVRVVRPPDAFTNSFGFDIARRIGSPAPQSRPARLYLNGEERGVYLLTEHVSPEAFGVTYFGHPDFYMFIPKGQVDRDSLAAYQSLEAWVLEHDSLSMQEAATRVDVDNLTRHLFTLMFCFTTDWAQGAVLYDRTDPEARWFWVHWDMDLSFGARGGRVKNAYELPVVQLITLEGETETLRRLSIITDQRHTQRHENDLRRLLLLRLLEDEAYRSYFVRLATDMLNHRLTPEYFDSLLETRRNLARRSGNFGRLDLRTYFHERPDFVLAELAQYFGLEAAVEVTVSAPASSSFSPPELRIDGFQEILPYRGRYFPGQTIKIETTTEAGPKLSHWLVDGESLARSELVFTVEHSTIIQPVFK